MIIICIAAKTKVKFLRDAQSSRIKVARAAFGLKILSMLAKRIS